ncbi:hypothetical protein Ping_2654 [Psychromonas ingrahamii 37]|uniref:Nucleotidyltransferase family protein n=1 Tax=Psychromonas ingrahamii (strain DSM 17664 / CCUG 51855 / 37) TaxID=357804 RepID=A1SY03_PSYIN|nr:nucleotidyltransferase family protein [Psychromonas ingrahamii]ABM04368.1 hypothetical protein Ping_2654 [Psychromonas ingrahamii 37]
MNYNKNISIELQTVAWLSLPQLSIDEVYATASLLKKVNFDRLQTLIIQHRTHPCIYNNIRQHFIEQVPSKLLFYLKNQYVKNKKRNTTQLGIYAELNYLFHEENIPIHFFKGLSLSKLIYCDIALRNNNDIDVLISKSDLGQANSILNSMGFYAHEFEALDDEWRNEYFKVHKDIGYTNQEGLLIELHLELSIPIIDEISIYQNKLQYRDKLFQTDLSVDELFYLCWHGSHTLFHRLKWLVDIKIYSEQLENNIDDSSYFSDNSCRIIVCSLYLLATIYKKPLPDKASLFYKKDWLCRMMIKTCLQGLDNPAYVNSGTFAIKRHLFEIFAFKSSKYKLAMLLCKLHPSILDYSSVNSLSPRWLFLIYPLRPFLAFKRKFL